MNPSVHPVDEKLPLVQLVPLAIQHVLVMYAGAVAVPLILGRALKLSPEDVAFLISADLFACGLATLVQSLGFPGVGIKLPVMMGVTFASVGPMLAMAATPGVGLLGIYGSVIVAGVFAIVVAPFVSRLLPLFPPVVTGTIILVIGISLMRVGINWAGGGLPAFPSVMDGKPVLRRFQDQPLQSVRGGDLDRLRHDPDRGRQFLPPVPTGAQAIARIRHPAGGDCVGCAQRLLQRARRHSRSAQQRGGRGEGGRTRLTHMAASVAEFMDAAAKPGRSVRRIIPRLRARLAHGQPRRTPA